MDSQKKSERFMKSVWSTKFLFLITALLGILFLSMSGISNAQYQYKTQQSSSKGGEAYIKVTSPAENEVWEKGKRYTIKWESKGILGNVKILLVSESAKPIDVSRSTVNSGSYNYVVPRTLGDGTYRVQVTKIDGSVKGESAAITIKGQALGVAKSPQAGQPSTGVSQYGTQTGTGQTGAAGTKSTQVAATPPATTAPSSGAAPSTAATPPAGTTASTGVTPSTAGAPSKGATPSTGVTGKTPAAAEKIVKQQLTLVKASEAETKNLPLQKSTASSTDLEIGGKNTSGAIQTPKIVVTAPKENAIWEAGKEYNITWESTRFTSNPDLKIALGRSQYQLIPITERTANTGAYSFRVPRNLGLDFWGWRVRVSTLDKNIRGWSPPFTLYSQDIDLQCEIYDPKFGSRERWITSEKEKWLEFNVLMRNDGVRFPISIDNVLVQVIKEPEEIVCYQEEWGFSGIYPHEWYKLPEPRKFRISSFNVEGRGKKVNLRDGAYRVEVWLDPQNRLGEIEGLRQNNKAVMKWIIK